MKKSTLRPGFIPRNRSDRDYIVKEVSIADRKRGEDFAIPPRDLWEGYAGDKVRYLKGGIRDVDVMATLLGKVDFRFAKCNRVLDFGCAAGRMTRHLRKYARQAAIWGVDIRADSISWCQHHLSDFGSFATTTCLPHLPFEDGYFDLILAGSVFTHIDALLQTWLLELARILKVGGRLYFTVHDLETIKSLKAQPHLWLSKRMTRSQIYRKSEQGFLKMVVGRGENVQVFYDPRYLQSLIPPMFEWELHESLAYLWQAAVILKRV